MTPSTETRLVVGRWVFTGQTTLAHGAVALQGDTIVEVGSQDALQHKYPHAAVIGSNQFAVMPGLINGHHHSNGLPNSLQGIADDFLEPWLFSLLCLRSQDPLPQTLFSIARLLRSGITSVVDFTIMSGTAKGCHDFLSHRLKAYEQAGMRVALAAGAKYQSHLVHGAGQDDLFLQSLPTVLAQKVRKLVPLQEDLPQQDYLELVGDMVKTYRPHPHIQVWFGPPGPQWVSDDLMVQIADAAASLGTGVQTHVTESLPEKILGPKFYGKSVIKHLQDLGVLSPRFSMAHGVWVTEEDIQILAETGASISHNPSSNLRLRAGVLPLNALLARGATVGLGMDGTAIGDDEDMFAEMRLAARLHREPQMKQTAPAWEDIFRLATQGSARLMLQENTVGQLAPGFKADLVLLDWDTVTWPWLAPESDPLEVMLMRAKAADVHTVLVNGNVVLKEGQPTGFDLGAVARELAVQLDAAPNRAAYRDLFTEIRPYLESWYAAWQVPELQSYAAFNSRV
jgi:cytosine/adenosine deaminase-related metal-dependent hydrolase